MFCCKNTLVQKRSKSVGCDFNSIFILFLHILCIITVLLLHNIEIVNGLEIKAFADFLHLNNLKHGIVVVGGGGIYATASILQHKVDAQEFGISNANNNNKMSDLQELLANFYIRFHNVRASKATFNANFYVSSPRVGIFVPELTDDDDDAAALQSNILQAASNGKFFNNSQAWFIVRTPTLHCYDATDKRLERLEIKNQFAALNINIDADVTLAFKCDNNSLLLYDIFKYCHNCDAELQIEAKGTWSIENGFKLHSKFLHSFVARRLNFHNITIKVGTTITEKPANITNWQHFNSVENKQYDAMQRKVFQLLKPMQVFLNMSFDVKFYERWGVFVNGKWDDLFGDIVAHKVEALICPIRFNTIRIKYMQFTPVVHYEVICFILRHPRRNSIRNIFFEPLTNEVWWSVLALIGLTIFLLTIHMHQERKQSKKQLQHNKQKQQQQQQSQRRMQRQNNKNISLKYDQREDVNQALKSANDSRLDNVVLLILEAIFMQGPSPSIFNLTSTRTLIMTIAVFSVILMQFYSAFIVGSLLSVSPRTLTTFEALYNSSFDIGMENNSYQYEIFENSTNPMTLDVFANRINKNAPQYILNMERGLQRVGHGKFAFHTSIDRAYRILTSHLAEAEYCDLQEIYMNPPYKTSIALHKGSPYSNFFAYSILRLQTNGLKQYNAKVWTVGKVDCSFSQNKEVEVDLIHFLPAIAFLAFAMVISLLVLAIELAVKRWQLWRNN